MVKTIENNNEHEIPITAENQKEVFENVESSTETMDEIKQNDENGSHTKYVEMLQRLKAEFENYKKRAQKEKLELSTYVKSQLICNLLPVVDDFDRMLDNSHPENNEIIAGTRLIYNKLMSILKEEGLEPIETVGRDFNPEIHEAVLIESGENDADDKIVAELQKGYLFKEKLLRPSKVKVYKTTK